MLSVLCVVFLFMGNFPPNQAAADCDIFERNANNISAACVKQMHVVCNTPDLWWRMFDASSKFLTSGMTYSNVIDLGNFPECLSIKYEDANGRILGKYCGVSEIIVNVALTPQTRAVLKNFKIDTNPTAVQRISTDTFAKMDEHFKDILYDQIPYVISKYSMCVPDACTPSEIGHYFLYSRILDDFSLPLVIYPGLTCETAKSNTDYEAGDIAFIIFLCLIGVLMIESTVYDALCQNFRIKPYHPLLLAFSILYNGKKLLYISKDTKEQIQVFNGMRFIGMMWIVAFHGAALFQAGVVPMDNLPKELIWNKAWPARYIKSALLAVDTFFFMTGFLLAFNYLKTAVKKSTVEQVVEVPKMYLHRYLRLTPSLAMMYLVIITILRFLGKGPIWSEITSQMKDICKQRWWEFFLYIQNYSNPDTMCVNPMWYLSADMQIFIVAPLVMIPTALFIEKRYKRVIGGLVVLTIACVIFPMFVRYYWEEGEGNVYTSHERLNNVLIGFIFGAVMRKNKEKPFIFSPVVNFVLWVVVLVVSVAFNIYWNDAQENFELLKYTLFMGLYKPVWCLCLVFIVYSCYHNQGGFVQWLLSLPSFQILGRLSYSMYVLHFMVELYAGGTLKSSTSFSNYFLFYNWCGHLTVTMILSVIWVLAFEYPMLTIDKYILGDGRKGEKQERRMQ